MTAVNVVVGADRVCLYSDGAALGMTGKVRRLTSKVRVLPEMGCAIAVRGELRALDALARILPMVARDFDQLYVAAKSGRLRRALGWRRALAGGHFALLARFDLVVAGWSAKGPRAFIYLNHGSMREGGGGSAPMAWTPFDVSAATIMPTVALSDAMRRDPEAAMPLIMDLQRRHREPSLFNPEGRQMVGGRVEKTTVAAAGIEIHTVGGWPDKMGQLIGGGKGHRRAWRRLMLFCAATWAATFVVVMLGEMVGLLVSSASK